MRTILPTTLLLAAALAGCATGSDYQPNKHIPQTGALRVHPGLLDPALQNAPKAPAAVEAATATTSSAEAPATPMAPVETIPAQAVPAGPAATADTPNR